MKKLLVAFTGITALSLAGFVSPVMAADTNTVTITGLGECGKCALHETAKCQNVIVAKQDGKDVTYYLKDNEVSKGFHDNLCKESKQVTATGTVKEVKGKMILTVTKIDVAK